MKKIFFVFAFIIAVFATNAQEKYAVLIGGDYGPVLIHIPPSDLWNDGDDMGPHGYDEFWNDTYLMWELLIKEEGGKEYSDENVSVLFADGYDFTFDLQDGRYKASHNGYDVVTDLAATEQNVYTVFTDLANTVTENDFLFVWIMSHGGDNNPASENDGNAYLYLYDYPNTGDFDGLLYDDELNTYLDNINANKKVVFIQAPHSGRFADKLAEDNTIIFTSSDRNESSYKADNLPGDAENEVIGTKTYSHGEFNFHIYSALAGETPVENNTIYNGQNLVSAPDLNDDLFKSIDEAVQWELNNTSVENETPQFSDIGSIREYTEFIYPTILHIDIVSNVTHRGKIGITKSLSISEGANVSWYNAITDFTDNSVMEITNQSQLNIGDNCIITGYGSYGRIKVDIFGELYIGENVVIKGNSQTEPWYGISFIESIQDINLNNVTFQDCYQLYFSALFPQTFFYPQIPRIG